MYRDPKTNHKIMLMSPPLALGQAVHEVIESLSQKPAEKRFEEDLTKQLDKVWESITGKRGGFKTAEEEAAVKERGREMLRRVSSNPGPLLLKAIKIRQELPYYWLSEEDNIILCGKIDWLVYDEKHDSVSILDFKTGKYDEDTDSLQLPIYLLLATKCQTKKVTGASYWYIDRDTEPVDVKLPDMESATKRVMEAAKRIALARKLDRFVCLQKDGCRACKPLEAIVRGEAEFVGVNDYRQDIYVL